MAGRQGTVFFLSVICFGTFLYLRGIFLLAVSITKLQFALLYLRVLCFWMDEGNGSLHLTRVGGPGVYGRHIRLGAEMSVRASLLKM